MKVRILLATSVLVIGSAVARQQPPAPSTARPNQETKDTTQPAASARSTPAEMKTQTYKGVLMDASCAIPQSGAAAASTAATTSGAQAALANPSEPAAAPASAERAANDQACSVSSGTNQFALKLQDGRIVRFDMVGNDRAREALKTKKKWSAAAGSGKPINAKVKGVMSGEKLIVSSIG